MASDVMGLNMKKLLFEASEEELSRTDLTQPAVTLVNTAVRIFLAEVGIISQGCGGFSLGEFAALEDAGVLSTEDLFTLVKKRGELMHRAGEKCGVGDKAPGMAAVVGLAAEKIDELFPAGTEGVYPANYNSPTQTVLSGTAEGLAKAEELCKKAGARRYIRLKVSGPFHSPLLEEAREEFAETVKAYTFKDPSKTLYSNVTGGEITTGDEAKKLSAAQIVSPVRWVEEENLILQGGYGAILETGPGKVLSGLWKSISKEPACLPCGTAEQIASLRS